MRSKHSSNYVWKLRQDFKNRVRITSYSYVRLALGSYVIKSSKWKLYQNYVTKITLELRQEVTLHLRQETTQMKTKKYVIIT